jgi:hypothetical protein
MNHHSRLLVQTKYPARGQLLSPLGEFRLPTKATDVIIFNLIQPSHWDLEGLQPHFSLTSSEALCPRLIGATIGGQSLVKGTLSLASFESFPPLSTSSVMRTDN